MSYATQMIADSLKQARLAKGVSQRELSELAGVPQAQISRIEAGTVDPRTTSLVALAHALDMELALVPRKAVPAVRTLSRQSAAHDPAAVNQANREWKRIEDSMRALQIKAPEMEAITKLQKNFADLQRFHANFLEPTSLKKLRQMLENINEPAQQINAIVRSQDLMRSIRNQLAHSPNLLSRDERSRPAYSLDEEDGDA